MKGLKSFVFCFICVLGISDGLETIINPGSNTLVSCGSTDDCYVICNGSYACRSNTFKFYTNNIELWCLGDRSCDGAYINDVSSSNIKITFDGRYSFDKGAAWINSNGVVNTICNGADSCGGSNFYYENTGSSINHTCYGKRSCWWGAISALPNQNSFSLYDMNVGGDGVDLMQIFLPLSTDSNVNLNLRSSFFRTFIYSLYGLSVIDNINCLSGSCSGHNLIYGKAFDQTCDLFNCASDQSLTQDIFDVTGLDIVYLTFDDGNNIGADDLDFTTNANNLLLFLTQTRNGRAINGKVISPSDKAISIVCVAFLWENACGMSTVFDLTLSHSATVIHEYRGLTIYGPKENFKYISYYYGGQGGNYYLNTTRNSIQFICNHIMNGAGCLQESQLYIDGLVHLEIECGKMRDCQMSDVYIANLNPLDYTLLSTNWNILCALNQADSCFDFTFHFTDYNYVCNYTEDDPCSMYLKSFSPTMSPTISTQSPTKSPTKFPTKSPTKSPTKFPSASPTKFPSKYPTETPTKFPSESPTKFPSKYPSESPTKFPSQSPTVPTSNPTEFPTKYPTESPTRFPTKSPTQIHLAVPSKSPSESPTVFTLNPTKFPTKYPTESPTKSPSNVPSEYTLTPTEFTVYVSPTSKPTSRSSAPTSPTSSPIDTNVLDNDSYQPPTVTMVIVFVLFATIAVYV